MLKRAEARRVNTLRHAYRRASKQAGDKGTAAEVDVYVGDDSSRERPLILFQHIHKTAGTALRFVIHANYPRAEHRVARLPRYSDGAWWRDLYEATVPPTGLICVAGHQAAHLLEVVRDRPVEAITLLREPVDRALSRYYFFKEPRWSLEEFFTSLEADHDLHPARVRALCNAQAVSLLTPHYDVRRFPLVETDSAADVWRQRLFAVVERHYLLGVQEHFRESVELFAKRFGWKYRHADRVRVNWERAHMPTLPAPRTQELIRRFNWLDTELHEFALRRFERRPRMRGRQSGG